LLNCLSFPEVQSILRSMKKTATIALDVSKRFHFFNTACFHRYPSATKRAGIISKYRSLYSLFDSILQKQSSKERTNDDQEAIQNDSVSRWFHLSLIFKNLVKHLQLEKKTQVWSDDPSFVIHKPQGFV
jgi:hypothetical protein